MKLCILAAAVGMASAYDIMIENFTAPVHSWRTQNDPVMGGQSQADFVIDNGVLKWDGEVVDVPSLSAPGFVTVRTTDLFVGFPDISSCDTLGLTVRKTSEYTGYRLAFGNARPPADTGGGFFTSGHKTPFFVDEQTTIQIPFSKFSTAWNDATGDIETECEDDERVCPTAEILRDIKNIQLWSEGRAGVVDLEVEYLFASGCGEEKKTAMEKKASSQIILEDFTAPAHTWTQANDPVMGGQSTGTFTIENGVGVFDGEVVDVPFLQAPGFIKVISDRTSKVPYADISMCTSLGIQVKETNSYTGFRVSLGTKRAPLDVDFFSAGHKSSFSVAESTVVTIPFSEFSNAWDAATGDITTGCADDPRLCLEEDVLTEIGQIQVWAEGVGGVVHLEIEKIYADGC